MRNNKNLSPVDDQDFPILSADLVLIHPPAFFDFRERRDIYFPFLGTSGDVPITPLYEYFPVGFKALKRYLSERGHKVEIINLSSILLRYPGIDLDRLLQRIDAKLIGIDLHWMIHVQGSLAIAEKIKKLQEDTPVVFGGISSTYYAHELIQYPFIDLVMRGYDTLAPMDELLTSLKAGKTLRSVPNLLWKSKNREVRKNEMSHRPATFSYGIDWSDTPAIRSGKPSSICEFLSVQSTGCIKNCGWCGNSKDAFKRTFGSTVPLIQREPNQIDYEFNSLRNVPKVDRYHLYAVGSYNYSKNGLEKFLERVATTNLRSVNYEQFYLPSESVMKQMVRANSKTTLTLSPESHDLKISKLAGRGVYTNDELELWIEKALDCGIFQIDLWYFIGMPEQDKDSVLGTVEYCQKLLKRFKGRRVNPMICPMIPFLDPSSNFFENPEQHGYRRFFRSVEEHRQGMMNASIINRINYETNSLSRTELVIEGFKAVRSLMEIKAEEDMLPVFSVMDFNKKIDDALQFIPVVHEIDCITDKQERARALEKIGDEIQQRNDSLFFSGVVNQAFPINRKIGGRWVDEMGWDSSVFESNAKRQIDANPKTSIMN